MRTTTAGLLIALLLIGLIGLIISMFGTSQDFARQKACKVDSQTLRTAEEAYAAGPGAGRYATMDQLVSGGEFLTGPSVLHTVVPTPNGSAFTVTILSSRCGMIGHTAGQTASDF